MIAISLALSWINDPIEWGPLPCVESCRPSPTMQWLNVMRWEVFWRHSAGVAPLNRGPEALRFSSVDQVREQCLVVARPAQSPPWFPAPEAER